MSLVANTLSPDLGPWILFSWYSLTREGFCDTELQIIPCVFAVSTLCKFVALLQFIYMRRPKLPAPIDIQ